MTIRVHVGLCVTPKSVSLRDYFTLFQFCESKLTALRLLCDFSGYLPAEIVLDRVIPHLVRSIHLPSAKHQPAKHQSAKHQPAKHQSPL